MEVQLKNHRLHYEVITPKKIESSTVLLFLHEALGSIGQWKSFPAQLCAQLGMKGIVYERQGHGKSSPLVQERTNQYLHNYALEELPQFIQKVLPTEKVILIGHSDGGTISLLYSHRYPTNILGTVTLAAHVINEPETIDGIAPAIEAYQQGKLDGLKKYHGEKTETLFYAWANIWRDSSFKDWDITQEIQQAVLPGLFLQGADDQYGTVRQLALIEQAHANGEMVEIKNCGHHPHLEQGPEVLSIVTKRIKNWISA